MSEAKQSVEDSQQIIADNTKKIVNLTKIGMFGKFALASVITTAVVISSMDFEKNFIDHVAEIEVNGEISKQSESASYSAISKSLEQAFKNEKVKGIIINMSSPGGSPDQSLMVYDKIRELKQKHQKPVDVVVSEVCASGCYFIASAADNIYSQKTSLIGSIGVITKGFDFTGAMDMFGVKSRTITAGENKALLDPYQKMTDEQVTFWKQQLQDTHEVFIESVKSGRGERLVKDSPDMFTGLIYSGRNALKLGLIDGFKNSDSLLSEKYGSLNSYSYSNKSGLLSMNGAKVSAYLSNTLSTAIAGAAVKLSSEEAVLR